MAKIRIIRKDPPIDHENPRDYLNHKDNPEQIEMSIERLIPGPHYFKKLPNVKGSFKDISKGLYGVIGKMYIIPKEGTVVYNKYLLLKGYAADIELLGFNEESQVYKLLKDSLENMAKENPEDL